MDKLLWRFSLDMSVSFIYLTSFLLSFQLASEQDPVRLEEK